MAGGLLNTQPPASVEQVFPGRKPLANVGILSALEKAEQDRLIVSGTNSSQTGIDQVEPAWGAPPQEDYSNQPKSQFEQDFEQRKGMSLQGVDAFKPELMAIYMRDQMGRPSIDTMDEDDYLRRTGLTRDDVKNVVEQTQQGKSMLQGQVNSMGQTDSETPSGPGDPFGAEIAGLQLGNMDLSGVHVGGMLGSIAKKGGGAWLKNMGVNNKAIAPLTNALYTATTTQDVGAVLNQAKKDGVSFLVKEVGNFAKDKLGTAIPIASLVSMGYSMAKDVAAGMDVSDAIGDAFSNTGIKIGAAMLGSLLGPIGTFLAPMVMSMMMGDNLVSEGVLGDAFNSRSNESFRDSYEDLGLSDKDRADLGRMAQSSVNDAAQLTQLERVRGYSTGSSNTGGYNIGEESGMGGMT